QDHQPAGLVDDLQRLIEDLLSAQTLPRRRLPGLVGEPLQVLCRSPGQTQGQLIGQGATGLIQGHTEPGKQQQRNQAIDTAENVHISASSNGGACMLPLMPDACLQGDLGRCAEWRGWSRWWWGYCRCWRWWPGRGCRAACRAPAYSHWTGNPGGCPKAAGRVADYGGVQPPTV